MTRKDYILIANALKTALSQPGVAATSFGVEQAAGKIADALATDNPRFSREHFLAVVRGEKDLNSRPARRKS